MSILSAVATSTGTDGVSLSPVAFFKRQLTILQEAAANWRLREKLAGLSDRSLLDIGIAEEEIHRVRAMERFTPKAWTDEKGSARRCSV